MRKICQECNRGFEQDNSPYDGYGPSCGKRLNIPVIQGREHLLTKTNNDDHEKYEFARESRFSNIGEDIKKSARHKFHEFRSLTEAESLGEGAGYAKKSVLLKNVDIDFLEGIDGQNDLAKLTAYLLLQKLPDSPQIIPRYNKSSDDTVINESYFNRRTGITETFTSTAGEARQKARKHYVEFFEHLKGLALNLNSNTQVDSVLANLRQHIHGKIEELRQNDPYNAFANQLVNFTNKQLRHKGNSIKKLLWELEDKPEAERIDIIKGLINKGKKTTKEVSPRKKGPVVETMYEETIERTGKPTPYKTYDSQAKFLTENVGLRAIQWGQYISDKERQEHMKHLTEAISDLSETLDIPVAKLSFDGQLGVSVGARGRGKASAHYTPDSKVINITKNGAGALAHEYLHAVDNLLAQKLSLPTFNKGPGNYEGQYLTTSARNPRVDKDLRDRMEKWNEVIEPFIDRMAKDPYINSLGRTKFHYYVNNRQELFARIGERIIQKKLESKKLKNTYLSGSKGTVFYPTDEELKTIEPAFDELLSYIKKVI